MTGRLRAVSKAKRAKTPSAGWGWLDFTLAVESTAITQVALTNPGRHETGIGHADDEGKMGRHSLQLYRGRSFISPFIASAIGSIQ